MLSFSDFVLLYWNKKTRADTIYTPEMVAVLEGITLGDATQYFTYCQSQPNVLETQLILQASAKKTPFGLVIVPTGSSVDPSVMDLTLDKVTLRQLLAALGK